MSTQTDRLGGFSSSVALKAPCRLATTANITLSGFQSIDGVLPTSSQHESLRRILVKDQTDAAENGIYVVQASGAPLRRYDMDAPSEVPGAFVWVREGAANGGKLFVCTNTTEPVLDDDDITFEEFGAGAGAGGSGDATGQLGAGFDGGLSILVAPKSQDVVVPYDGELTGWRAYGMQNGDLSVGVGIADHAGFDTFTDMVGAGAHPALSSAKKATGSVAAWDITTVTAGDIIRFTLSTVSAIRQAVVVLDYDRT